MHVVFESRNPDAVVLRDFAVKQTKFEMHRLRWLMPNVKVQLSDVAAPPGSVTKRCRVELSSKHAGQVVVTSVSRSWRLAIEAALVRAGQALLRVWRRRVAHAVGAVFKRRNRGSEALNASVRRSKPPQPILSLRSI